ncbi:MAG: GcrA family cell cycle regulator [Hyphomicrobiaceae bacterium]
MSNKASKHKTLLELEANECRWLVGDPRKADFHFAAHNKSFGRPYCIQHWPLSFVPGKSRHSASVQQAAAAARQLANKKAA